MIARGGRAMSREQASELHFLRNVGLVMTYRCPIACPHCVLEAGPSRTEEMELGELLGWVEQIAAYRRGHVRVLSLTGGEPFYRPDVLAAVVRRAAELGLLTSVATNGFWAVTADHAVEELRSLDGVGLLSVSTDSHHLEFIGFDRVRNVLEAAERCAIPCRVAVCTERLDDPAHVALMDRLADITDPGNVDTTITFPAGRALTRLGTPRGPRSPAPPEAACTAAATPVIFPDGRVVACIGPVMSLRGSHPLLLGNLRERPLADVFDAAEDDAVLHALRVWGPGRLAELVATCGPRHALPSSYLAHSPCDACYRLLAEPSIGGFLRELGRDRGFRELVRWARGQYLDEPARTCEGP